MDVKAVLTVAVLLGVLLRSNHWQLPSSCNGGRAIAAKRAPSNPEEKIYVMFDAARSGDTQACLDSIPAPL